jgi:predicted lipoprotein with Yx(FWY)xxD motif
MIKTRVAMVALLGAGLALLSACGPGDSNQATKPAGNGAATDLASVNLATGTAKEHNAPANTGDFYSGPSNSPPAMKWVQLTAGAAGGLKPIVLNGAGFTLYRFDKDTAHPSKSNCNDACATTWPPVLVQPGSKIFLDGVARSDVGVVKRDDGTLQVTVGSWPVYRFSKDTRPGQTNGEGVGGTWFAVSPTGGKVLPPTGRTSSAPAPGNSSSAPVNSAPAPGTSSAPAGGGVKLGNGSVILDSGKNFTEPTGSEGVAGPGCQNVGQPNLASSLQLSGGPIKIWTGRDCTGTSAVVTGDVADLSRINFDKKIVSIRFGG